MSSDMERGSRLTADIAKAIRGCSADEAHPVLCWTLARGGVLSDLDAAWK
jgi:hypothetical protein